MTRIRKAAIVAVVCVLLFSVVALTDLASRLLVLDEPPATTDAAVVFAGDPDYERTTAAAALVRAGEARLLVLTGGEKGPGDSAESLRAKAIALGVPPERIRLETVSHSTREAVLAVLPILRAEGVRKATVVTSPYHSWRAFRAARRAWPDIEVHSHPARPSSWSERRWWRDPRSRRIVVTEYAKLLYYWARGWL